MSLGLLLRYGLTRVVSGGGTGATLEAITTTASAVSTTSHAINLGTTVEGELVLVLIKPSTNSTVVITPPTGWAEVARRDSAGTSGIYSWVVDGTTPTTADFSYASNRRIAAHAYRFSGATEAEAVYEGSNVVDPPSLAPSWGSASVSTFWIAVAFNLGGEQRYTAGGIPADYENETTAWNNANSTANFYSGLVSASRAASLASEDPGAFTLEPQNPHAATIAVR